MLDGGMAAAGTLAFMRPVAGAARSSIKAMAIDEMSHALGSGAAQLIDLRPSTAFRAGHIAQATWSIRPRIAAAFDRARKTIVLIADEPGIADLAALDLRDVGATDIRMLTGDIARWRAAGVTVVATPDHPTDADCIDFLFFVYKRHEGDTEAARQYLAWETSLLDQLDAQERGAFRLADL